MHLMAEKLTKYNDHNHNKRNKFKLPHKHYPDVLQRVLYFWSCKEIINSVSKEMRILNIGTEELEDRENKSTIACMRPYTGYLCRPRLIKWFKWVSLYEETKHKGSNNGLQKVPGCRYILSSLNQLSLTWRADFVWSRVSALFSSRAHQQVNMTLIS